MMKKINKAMIILATFLYKVKFFLGFYYYKIDKEIIMANVLIRRFQYKNLFLNDSLEVVCVTIVVIISIIIDLILGNFNHLITSLVISSIFYVIGDSFMSTYDKILMEQKYYHFMDV